MYGSTDDIGITEMADNMDSEDSERVTPRNKSVNLGYGIARTGNKYVINTGPVESNNMVDYLIEELYEKCYNKSVSAGRKAIIFKSIGIICNILILAFGIATIVASVGNPCVHSYLKYLTAFFGGAITALKGILSVFSIEKRSIVLKRISIELLDIALKLSVMQSTDMTGRDVKDIINELNKICKKVNSLDMSMFDSSVVKLKRRGSHQCSNASAVSAEENV